MRLKRMGRNPVRIIVTFILLTVPGSLFSQDVGVGVFQMFSNHRYLGKAKGIGIFASVPLPIANRIHIGISYLRSSNRATLDGTTLDGQGLNPTYEPISAKTTGSSFGLEVVYDLLGGEDFSLGAGGMVIVSTLSSGVQGARTGRQVPTFDAQRKSGYGFMLVARLGDFFSLPLQAELSFQRWFLSPSGSATDVENIFHEPMGISILQLKFSYCFGR